LPIAISTLIDKLKIVSCKSISKTWHHYSQNIKQSSTIYWVYSTKTAQLI